ncbi:phosphotriesterase-related protein-like [Amphibalanus amphitrite]|uniref:phosphotriesterase-related protein-like n=1 Tax=Amphibalanus amphitrite TaxID=1232801 RepID=UPI001C91104F|nr:phosphotriesterase-related protein-like [Amphibalanus amphitrite]
MATTKGKVQTVLGLVEPSSLGVTMMHEHMHLDFNVAFIPPEGKYAHKADCDFTLENSGWIRQNPYASRQNVTFCDAAVDAAMRDELRTYRENGGGAVIEVTNYGIGRDAALLAAYSRDTAVTIVTGTGFYQHMFQLESDLALTVEEMHDRALKDITDGCPEAPLVKAGVIGEVGSGWPIHDFERRAIQAAALGQQATGCPVNFHPGRDPAAAPEVLRIFQEAGGDVSNCIMSHLDRSIQTAEGLSEFAKIGSYLEFDLFGIETSHYTLAPHVDMPSDAQRIQRIKHLVEDGYEDRVVISHDIHTKHRLTKFGGHGFSHILENVVPMMKVRGLTEETINKILSTNPQAAMTFKK